MFAEIPFWVEIYFIGYCMLITGLGPWYVRSKGLPNSVLVIDTLGECCLLYCGLSYWLPGLQLGPESGQWLIFAVGCIIFAGIQLYFGWVELRNESESLVFAAIVIVLSIAILLGIFGFNFYWGYLASVKGLAA